MITNSQISIQNSLGLARISVLKISDCVMILEMSTTTTSDLSRQITCHHLDETTSNLVRHVKTCNPSSVHASFPFSAYSLGRFRYLVAAWSACRARPHVIIEDEELREILVMLYSVVEIHSHQTVARDISDMYERSRVVIACHLQSVKQRLHLLLDGWTSPNMISFLGVNVTYFEDGKIHGFVLDFVR